MDFAPHPMIEQPGRGRRAAAGSAPVAPRRRRRPSPLVVLIFIYILVGVGRVHQYFSFLSPLRPALLTFLLIVGYVVLNPSSLNLSNIWKTWPGTAVVLFGATAVLSGIFGISLGATGMFIIQEYASLLIFAGIMVSSVGRLDALRALMFAFVASAAFWLYLSYFVLGASSQGAVGGILRLDVSYTYDPNDICVIFNTSIPLALLFFRTAENKWVRRGSLLVALAIPGAVALTGSRGGLVGLVGVAAALLLVVREVSFEKKAIAVFAAILAILIVAPPGYWDQMKTILNPTEDYNWTDPVGRRQIMLRGFGYIAQFPVFGVGASNFPRAEGTIGPMAKLHVAGTGLRFTAPHNTPLQITAEMGLVALVLWLSVIWVGTVWMLRHRRRFSRHSEDPTERFLYQACTFLPIAWMGFFVSSQFVSFAYLVPYYILLAYTAGLVLAVRRWEGAEEPVPQKVGRIREWRSVRAPPGPPVWEPRPLQLRSGSPQPGDGLTQEG